MQTITLDLSEHLTESGTYEIIAKAIGTNFNDSAASNSVTYTIVSGYSVKTASDMTYSDYEEVSCYFNGDTSTERTIGTTTNATLATEKTSVTFVRHDGSGGSGSVRYTMNGVTTTLDLGGQDEPKTVQLTGDMTINYWESYCLTGDTLITMADRSQKRIDEIHEGDMVLAIDPKTLEFVADKVTYSDSDCNKTHNRFDIWTFEDGSSIKTVHRHRLYNVESEAMVYMDEWKIGDHAYTIDGREIALIGHEQVDEIVNHYTIFTERQNYFANGLLAGNRDTPEMLMRQREV